jgi:DNA-binding MarR family transcriptional regulator
MTGLDSHIHSPTRLRLMSMLSGVSEVEFGTLRDGLEVSDSVLSKHLAVLSGEGYLRSRKGVHRGRRTTWVSLTAQGRRALRRHVKALRAIIADVE